MLGVRKLGSLVALIFGILIKFLDFSFFDKFKTVLLTLLQTLTTSLLLALNAFGAKFDNPVAFCNKVSNAAILLKPWIKHQ